MKYAPSPISAPEIINENNLCVYFQMTYPHEHAYLYIQINMLIHVNIYLFYKDEVRGQN